MRAVTPRGSAAFDMLGLSARSWQPLSSARTSARERPGAGAGATAPAGPAGFGAGDSAAGLSARTRAKEPTPRSVLRRGSFSSQQPQNPPGPTYAPVAEPWATQIGAPATNSASAAPGQVVRLGQSPQKAAGDTTPKMATLLAQLPVRDSGEARSSQQQQKTVNLEMRPLGGRGRTLPPAQQMAVQAEINPQSQI